MNSRNWETRGDNVERREARSRTWKFKEKHILLYFDRKNFMTRVLLKNNKTKVSPSMKVDDHYDVLTEPGNGDVKSDDERPNIDEGLLIYRLMKS